LTQVPDGLATERVVVPELSRIADGKLWSVVNAEVRAATEQGRGVVRMRPKGEPGPGSNIGLALVQGVSFAEGTLEIDLKGNGQTERSFLGVAFAVADDKRFEAVYFRPFNFMREGEFRRHAVQYVAWPVHTWEQLRADTPNVFEAAVKPVPDPSGWFHARVEVTKHKVSVWVDDAKEPCLVVERLADREQRQVGLFVDSREGTFRDLKIRAAK
jgi:hypothetical protein